MSSNVPGRLRSRLEAEDVPQVQRAEKAYGVFTELEIVQGSWIV